MRPNTASIAEMVSAAVFPVSRAASVTRDFRSRKTSTGRAHLQMMRSPWWIPTRSATPSTALVPQRKVGVSIPNAGLLLGFQGTKTARREGISSPFSDAGGCTSPQNSALQWPASPRPSMVFGRSWIDARSLMASREALARRGRRRLGDASDNATRPRPSVRSDRKA
jgi:hypothetical protein